MSGPAQLPDPSDDQVHGRATDTELERTDLLLDQLAGGSIDLSVDRSQPGELAALTLLRTASDPDGAGDSGAAPAFLVAVRHHAPAYGDREPRRWRRLAGTTVAVKIGAVAVLTALGVAAAGATGGLGRYVLPERDASTTTSVLDPTEAPTSTGGGSASSGIAAVSTQIRLLDEPTFELLRSSCSMPRGEFSRVVRTVSERAGSSGADTCAAVEQEAVKRQSDDAAAPTATVPADDERATADPGLPGHGSAEGDRPAGSGNTEPLDGNPDPRGGNPDAGGGNPNARGGNPDAGGSANSHRSNPNANPAPNPNSGGAANQGGGPNAGGNLTPGNPDAGGGQPSAGSNPDAGGGNPNGGRGQPSAGSNPKANGAASTDE